MHADVITCGIDGTLSEGRRIIPWKAVIRRPDPANDGGIWA